MAALYSAGTTKGCSQHGEALGGRCASTPAQLYRPSPTSRNQPLLHLVANSGTFECPLTDCSFGQVCSWEARACNRPSGKLTIPLDVNRVQLSGLIDSECGETLVHQNLTPSPDLLLGVIPLQCIHGDVKPYPKAQVALTVRGEMWTMMIGMALRLAYPIIVGCDWKGFVEVLCVTTAGAPPPEVVLKGEPVEEADGISEGRRASDPDPTAEEIDRR